MQKTIFVGLLAGLAMFIVGFGLNFLFGVMFPGFQAIYENTNIFMAMDSGRGSLFYIYPFVLGISLAWLYKKLSVENRDICNFAFIYFVVAVVPAFIINTAAFNLPISMILTWSISGFVHAIVAAAVFKKMLK